MTRMTRCAGERLGLGVLRHKLFDLGAIGLSAGCRWRYQ